jgi:hypothetical protein
MTDFIDSNKFFHRNKKKIDIENGSRTILNFWRWGYSDLLQNIYRGILAEFLISWALDLDTKPQNPWNPYDLKTKEGNRIEIKSTGYLQAWDYGTKQKPKFIIRERQRWTDKGLETKAEYNADIYILAYHKETNRKTIDPMDLDQWEFWVFSKQQIVSLLRNRKSISVSQLKKEDFLPIKFEEIKKQVNQIS